jgi:DNA-binding transcriptional MerR regulator
MTARMLGPADLTATSGVPAEKVHRYAEAGLLPPPRRDGDRLGYPPAEADTVPLLAAAERLGLIDALPTLADAWHGGDCATTSQRLTEAVNTRLDVVQAAITVRQEQMAGAARDTGEWAESTRQSVPLFEDAARLQAVVEALKTASHTGDCQDGCGCLTALHAPVTTYRFPTVAAPDAVELACDLAADGGDAHHRIEAWQQVLTRVQRRDPLPGPPQPQQAGVVLRFDFDVDLAATLGRLAAAEYRCCSFGSYTLVIDDTGLRLEIRVPAEAADTLTAVVGAPTAPESVG